MKMLVCISDKDLKRAVGDFLTREMKLPPGQKAVIKGGLWHTFVDLSVEIEEESAEREVVE